MKNSLYSQRIFVTDLLIVSVWALFAMHTTGGIFIVPSMILMRLALCFEMHSKSRWSFSGAIFFALAYIGCFFDIPNTNPVIEPIKHMIYVSGCLVGFTEEMFDAFQSYTGIYLCQPFWEIWIIISAWLVITPLICSWQFKSIIKLYKTKRKLWWYIGFVLLFVGWIHNKDKNYSAIFFCILMSAMPLVYNMMYKRNSLLYQLLKNKVLMSYFLIVIIIIVAMYSGLYNVIGLKVIVAVIAPVVLYVVAIDLKEVKCIKTMPAVLFAISGLVFILVYNRIHEYVIILLSVGCFISLIASVLTYRQNRSITAAAMLLISSVFILPVLLLGYNPYAVITADYVHTFGNHQGLYLIESNGRKGLRDRYSVVIEPINKELYSLDESNRYIAAKSDGKGNYGTDEYGVYCLPQRRFVIDQVCRIDSIVKIHGEDYKMIDADGRYFATFTLPILDHGTRIKDIEMKAHYSDASTHINEFLELTQDSEINTDGNQCWQRMKDSNPKAFSLLGKILAMSGFECSPANDLTFAKAVATIIDNDVRYKGNTNKAFKEINRLLNILSSGDQPEMNIYASLKRLMSSICFSMAYEDLISHGALYYDEYVAWHNLMEAIINYYEYYSYNTDWYSSKPIDIEFEKAGWISDRKRFVNIEKGIILGKTSYLCNNDSLSGVEDVIKITSYYHSEYDPGFYHAMWYEIRPALIKWLEIREKIANTLPTSTATSYRESTKQQESDYSDIIKKMDNVWLRPALHWNNINKWN